MQVSEYLTKLPEKKVLEERLKMYGRLLEEEGLPAKHAEQRSAQHANERKRER
jgi:hypothetical protein